MKGGSALCRKITPVGGVRPLWKMRRYWLPWFSRRRDGGGGKLLLSFSRTLRADRFLRRLPRRATSSYFRRVGFLIAHSPLLPVYFFFFFREDRISSTIIETSACHFMVPEIPRRSRISKSPIHSRFVTKDWVSFLLFFAMRSLLYIYIYIQGYHK